MKYCSLILLLFYCIPGFCQPEKDALLKRDQDIVKNKLILMHYLDNNVLHYFTSITKAEKDKGEGLAYFYKNLITNSPVASPTVAEFLGYGNEVPANNADFFDTVFDKVFGALINITQIYGYPSQERIKIVIDGKSYTPVVFVTRTVKIDATVKRLFKSEYKIGNMTKGEYDTFKYFISNRTK